MTAEVGSGQVSIFPTFKGFRRAVSAEVDGTAKSASSRFSSGFKSAGGVAGKGFASSFRAATAGVSADTLKRATADVTTASRALSAARLKELDVAGRVRIAETQLSAARERYASDSAQVVRAEERLASAERSLAAAESSTAGASDRLAASKRTLTEVTARAGAAAQNAGGRFSRLSGILGDAGARGGRLFSSGFRDVLGGALGANIITGIGFAIGRGINNGIRDGIGFTLDGIGLASDLSETRSAVRQVFGAAASDVEAFAARASDSLGQTTNQALGAAQTFGIFGKAAGLTGKPLSKFSTNLVGLATDLASFKNTSPEEAIEALGAGLRGESEPLRRYGVLLDDAALKQRAMALGIYSGSGALTQQQRVLAAQAEIFAQTSDAQGDFAKTSDGLANQQRIFAARLEETQSRFGAALLPTAVDVLGFANKELLPILGDALDTAGPKFVTSLRASLPDLKDALQSAAEALPAAIDFGTAVAEAVTEAFKAGADLIKNADAAGFATNDAFNGPGGLFSDGIFTTVTQKKEDWNEAFEFAGRDAAEHYAAGLRTADSWARAEDDTERLALNVATRSRLTLSGSFGSAGRELGGHFADGIADGMDGGKGRVATAAHNLANAAVNSLKIGFDSHSPSKKTYAEGGNFVDGFTGALRDKLPAVRSASVAMTAAALMRRQSLSVQALASSPAVAAAGTAATSGGDRVIYMDGVPAGWLREAAGQARIVWNDGMEKMKAEVLAGGELR